MLQRSGKQPDGAGEVAFSDVDVVGEAGAVGKVGVARVPGRQVHAHARVHAADEAALDALGLHGIRHARGLQRGPDAGRILGVAAGVDELAVEDVDHLGTS